jgi:beta-glucanase (GH16 family)
MNRRARLAALTLMSALLVSPLATAPAGAASTDACGTRPLKADSSLWSCTFVDNFSTRSLDRSKWLPQTGFASGAGSAVACYLDDPDNVSVASGVLRLTVRKETSSLDCPAIAATTSYTAGMVTTYHRFSQQYGRFEARIKVATATTPGLQEAFWLWPDDRYGSTGPWPESGEIDVAETYSSYPDLAVPYLHYTADDNAGAVPGVNTAWDCHATRGVFNTYAVEWDAASIRISVNGVPCLTNTSGDQAFRKRYILALTAGLGSGANSYDGSVPLPATMSVDYVKVWQ